MFWIILGIIIYLSLGISWAYNFYTIRTKERTINVGDQIIFAFLNVFLWPMTSIILAIVNYQEHH